MGDGRPIWAGNFSGSGAAEVLFYYPGDRNWWLGSIGSSGQLRWNLAGNTSGFGQIWDGRPFWIGDFNGDGRVDVLFHYPGDGNWWLGSFGGNQLGWSLAGNTGRPCAETMTVHYKSVLPLTQARRDFLNVQHDAMETLFSDNNNVRVRRGTFEDLSGNAALAALATFNVGACIGGQLTADHRTLFPNRNNAGANDVVVYLCQTLVGGAGNFVGCAVFPAGQPGCVVVQSGAEWLTAHEVGHVLGLGHVTNSDRLMNPNTGWTNVPPDLDATERQTMRNSNLTTPC